MSTSSTFDPNAYYTNISLHLYSTLGFSLMVIGTIGSVASCFVFGEKTMRQNPASIYFIAYNIANLIRLWDSLFLTAIAYYGINPVYYNVPLCKIHFYIKLVFFMLTPYYLILISIDRTLITSSNTRARERSSLRLAYRSLAAVTMFFLLFFAQLFVFINIYPIYPGVYICYMPPGNYRLFMSMSAFVLNGCLPSILLTTFGILTLRNLRQGRIQPATADSTTVTVRVFVNRL